MSRVLETETEAGDAIVAFDVADVFKNIWLSATVLGVLMPASLIVVNEILQ